MSQEQIELQSTIEAQGVLNKQFARLIVEQVTSVMAGNLNALLKVIEQQHAEQIALTGGLSAEIKKVSTGQAEIAGRVSDVEERVNELNTRHGEQWEEINQRLKASEADRAVLHREIDQLRAWIALQHNTVAEHPDG